MNGGLMQANFIELQLNTFFLELCTNDQGLQDAP